MDQDSRGSGTEKIVDALANYLQESQKRFAEPHIEMPANFQISKQLVR
jgi:hypothetical protein